MNIKEKFNVIERLAILSNCRSYSSHNLDEIHDIIQLKELFEFSSEEKEYYSIKEDGIYVTFDNKKISELVEIDFSNIKDPISLIGKLCDKYITIINGIYIYPLLEKLYKLVLSNKNNYYERNFEFKLNNIIDIEKIKIFLIQKLGILNDKKSLNSWNTYIEKNKIDINALRNVSKFLSILQYSDEEKEKYSIEYIKDNNSLEINYNKDLENEILIRNINSKNYNDLKNNLLSIGLLYDEYEIAKNLKLIE